MMGTDVMVIGDHGFKDDGDQRRTADEEVGELPPAGGQLRLPGPGHAEQLFYVRSCAKSKAFGPFYFRAIGPKWQYLHGLWRWGLHIRYTLTRPRHAIIFVNAPPLSRRESRIGNFPVVRVV